MTVVRPAPGVGSVGHDDIVYAARLPDGPALVLEGCGALIWHQLVDDGDLRTLRERIAAALIDPPPDLDDQIDAFVHTLRQHGLLTG